MTLDRDLTDMRTTLLFLPMGTTGNNMLIEKTKSFAKLFAD